MFYRIFKKELFEGEMYLLDKEIHFTFKQTFKESSDECCLHAATAGNQQLTTTSGNRQLTATAGQQQLTVTAGQQQLTATTGQQRLTATGKSAGICN